MLIRRFALVGPVVAAAALSAVVPAGARQQRPLPDKDAFLADAVKKLRSDNLAQGGYVYTERETRRERDSDGTVTKTTVRVTEVYPSPEPRLTYRRRLSVDGEPTADLADRDRRYREKVRDWIQEQEAKGLKPAEAARLKREDENQKERTIIAELTKVFTLHLDGREFVDGRPTLVFSARPNPEYDPSSREANIAHHFAGRAWFDEEDRELVRAHFESVDPVTYGWGLIARLSPGAVAHFERRKYNGQAWLPTYAHFRASGRVLLLKRVGMDQTVEYFGYRKGESGGVTTFPLNPGSSPGPQLPWPAALPLR